MATFRDIWNIIIDADSKGIKRGVDEAGNAVDTTFKGKIQGALSKFGLSSQQSGALLGTAVAGGALAAGEKVAAFVGKSIDEFEKQSQAVLHFKDVTQLSADASSRWVAVADDFAVSAEDLSAGIGKLDKTAGTTPDKLRALGIELGKNSQGAYDASQTFLNVVSAYNATDDASTKAAIAQGAFGKQWQGLVKLLDQGSDSIRSSLGSVKGFQLFSEKDLQQSEDYRHSMDDLHDAVAGFQREVGQAAIPAVVDFTRQLQLMAETADKITPGGLKTFFEVFAASVGVVGGAGGIADVIKEINDKLHEFSTQNLEAGQAVYTLDKANYEAGTGFREFASNAINAHQGLIDQTKALEDAKRALENYRGELNATINGQLGLEGALNNATDAIATFTEKTKDHTTTTTEMRDVTLSAKEAFVSLGERTIMAAQQQATLKGEILSANSATDAQITSLEGVARTMDPSNPLRQWLSSYIQDLKNIPGQISSTVELVQSQGPNATTGKAIVSNIKAYEAGAGSGWRSGPQ